MAQGAAPATGQTPAPPAGAQTPADEIAAKEQEEDSFGQGRFDSVCSACHEAARAFEGGRRGLAEWKDLIEQMAPDASAADKTVILKYLAHTSGTIYINVALAPEIAEVLRISQADADAIVNFRKSSGNFADFAALAKVPGINLPKLEQAKDSINFR